MGVGAAVPARTAPPTRASRTSRSTSRGRRAAQGLGKTTLAALIDEAEGRGYWKLVSRIFPENEASLRLCRSLGFREVGMYRRHAKLDGDLARRRDRRAAPRRRGRSLESCANRRRCAIQASRRSLRSASRLQLDASRPARRSGCWEHELEVVDRPRVVSRADRDRVELPLRSPRAASSTTSPRVPDVGGDRPSTIRERLVVRRRGHV